MVFIAATVPLLLSGNTKRSEFRMAPVDSPLKVAYSKVSSRTHHYCVIAENVSVLPISRGCKIHPPPVAHATAYKLVGLG